MRHQTKIFVAAVVAVLLAVTVYAAWPAAPPPETKDRLTSEAMEQMVAGPMAVVRKDGLASGRARFEQLLAAKEARYGRDSVQVADLITAFGVELYLDEMTTEDPAELQASRDYLRDAIPRYRKAFGPNSPEVAVALHSFADADISLHGKRLTPEAEAALREALRIRRAALGPDDRETRATEDRLARAKRDAPAWPPNSAGSALEVVEDAVQD